MKRFGSFALKNLGCLILILAIPGVTGCRNDKPAEVADLVLKNGKIATVDPHNRIQEALAVKGDKIIFVGPEKESGKYIGDGTRVIDLQGKLAVPGLIDAHGHFMSLGRSKQILDLTKVKNWDEVITLIKKAVETKRPGEWIYGRGWHQEKWDKVPEPNLDGLPFHHRLSEVSKDNPVFLTHASGHSGFANQKAMELSGITSRTQAPEGGEIVKDQAGNPIGLFRETAQRLIRTHPGTTRQAKTPEEQEEENIRIIQLATKECLEKGICGFHDAGVSFATIDLYKRLATENKLRVRINAMISENNENLEKRVKDYLIIGHGHHFLTVRTIKRLIDGALGAHGAWLLNPYNSLPDSVGLNTEPIPAMKKTAQIAIMAGFQLATHAIGDRGNRETLDIYEEAFKNHPDKGDLRWRIEHAQHLHPDDIGRFGRLKVIASMQAVHCTSDGPWVFKRLGEKRAGEGAYVWRKLIKSGAIICNGTDVPVEDVDPLPGFYAFITRKMKNGVAFFPGQCLNREEALRSYTINAAYSAFEENIKGSLEVGKLADITVLSRDILTIPANDILKTEVCYTIVGGKIEFQKK